MLEKDAKAYLATLSAHSLKCFGNLGEALKNMEDGGAEVAKEIGVTVEELAKMAGAEVMARRTLAKVDDEKKAALEKETLEEVKAEEKTASATRVSGETKKGIWFVKEGEGWKVELEKELGCAGHEEEEKEGGCEGSDKE